MYVIHFYIQQYFYYGQYFKVVSASVCLKLKLHTLQNMNPNYAALNVAKHFAALAAEQSTYVKNSISSQCLYLTHSLCRSSHTFTSTYFSIKTIRTYLYYLFNQSILLLFNYVALSALFPFWIYQLVIVPNDFALSL